MERDEAQELFTDLCARIDFDRKYFALVDRTRPRRPGQAIPFSEREAVLLALGRRFSYHQEERFYKVFPTGLPESFRLHLGLESGSVEFIAVAITPMGGVGDVFSGLARVLAQSRDPSFVTEPPYPRPWFRDTDELADVLLEGYSLFDEIAAAVLAARFPLA